MKYVDIKELFRLARALWRTRNEPVVIVPKRIITSINEAPVSTEVCCCGAEMKFHGFYDNHTPRDQWDYILEGINKELAVINGI